MYQIYSFAYLGFDHFFPDNGMSIREREKRLLPGEKSGQLNLIKETKWVCLFPSFCIASLKQLRFFMWLLLLTSPWHNQRRRRSYLSATKIFPLWEKKKVTEIKRRGVRLGRCQTMCWHRHLPGQLPMVLCCAANKRLVLLDLLLCDTFRIVKKT